MMGAKKIRNKFLAVRNDLNSRHHRCTSYLQKVMNKVINTHYIKKFGIAFAVSSLFFFQVTAENTTSSNQTPEKKIVSTSTSFSLGVLVSQLFSKEQNTPSSRITVQNITAVSTKNEVLVTWIASNLATGRIYYGTTSPVLIASGTIWVAASKYGNYANSKANIRNLSTSTTYYYRVLLEEASGGKVASEEASFKTKE